MDLSVILYYFKLTRTDMGKELTNILKQKQTLGWYLWYAKNVSEQKNWKLTNLGEAGAFWWTPY